MMTRKEIGESFLQVANVARTAGLEYGIRTAYLLAVDAEIYGEDKRAATALRTQARALELSRLGLISAAAAESRKVGELLA